MSYFKNVFFLPFLFESYKEAALASAASLPKCQQQLRAVQQATEAQSTVQLSPKSITLPS